MARCYCVTVLFPASRLPGGKGMLLPNLNDYHNNGLDSDFSNDADEGMYQGRSRITYDPADLGKFRTPTLHNVMVTAPYMHDGRIPTIEAVLQHYSHHIKTSATIDARLVPDGVPGLRLTNEEQQAIIAFLATLTDSIFLNNPSLGRPSIP